MKDMVKLRKGQLKVFSMRRRKKKNEEKCTVSKGPMKNYHAYQHTHYESPRMKKEKKGRKKY